MVGHSVKTLRVSEPHEAFHALHARPDYGHGPSIDSMMTASCVDRHIDGTTLCG